MEPVCEAEESHSQLWKISQKKKDVRCSSSEQKPFFGPKVFVSRSEDERMLLTSIFLIVGEVSSKLASYSLYHHHHHYH